MLGREKWPLEITNLLAGCHNMTWVPAGGEALKEGKEWKKSVEPLKIWKCEIIANRRKYKVRLLGSETQHTDEDGSNLWELCFWEIVFKSTDVHTLLPQLSHRSENMKPAKAGKDNDIFLIHIIVQLWGR